MKPIGPLMWEHRLIEQMIAAIKKELRQTGEGNRANTAFIPVAVDFMRTYADRTHHGKEEDILFRDLARKQLSPEHKKIMDELVAEHILARKTVASLVAVGESYAAGNTDSLPDIVAAMQQLVTLYPRHIEKEDKHFFYPCLEYFSRQEQGSMLQEFWEFDRKMIHEKYQRVVEEISRRGPRSG